jgi:hypothetical protein
LFISMLQDRRDAPPDTTAASTEEAVPRNTSLVFIARERKSLCPVVLKVIISSR